MFDKTAISARTNRQIGGRAPSKYLAAVEKAADIEHGRMNEILASHCITPELLRADRFWNFYAARAETLTPDVQSGTLTPRGPVKGAGHWLEAPPSPVRY